jgi:protein CpxP
MQLKYLFISKPLLIASIAVGSVFLAASGTSYADTSSAQDCTGSHHFGRHGDFGAGLDKRLDKLKTDLQLQPNQEGAWQTYTGSLKSQQENRKAQWQQAKAQAATTLPERLDQHVTFAKQREADLEAMVSATKQFYSTLTPAQRVVMDKRLTHKQRTDS